MGTTNINTPGVFTKELNAFPDAVLAIPTAVPAFIGYTPQAKHNGKSFIHVPKKISSFAAFKEIYCLPDPPPPAHPSKQYNPQYYLVKQKLQPVKGDWIINDETFYSVLPDPNTIYYLYNSVRLFYENGGGDAYIVSVGPYGAASGTPIQPGDQIVNPNVQLNDLLGGLSLLLHEQEPTMYICPEATLLSVEANGTLMQAMLLQSSNMGTTMSIFDVIGGNAPDPVQYLNDIEAFKQNSGTIGLNHGMAYYPFIGTSVMNNKEIDYTNLFGGDITPLASILSTQSNPSPAITAIIANISNPASGLSITQNNNALIAASTVYSNIIESVLANVNMLPPSGAMAGVITTIDKNFGVWHAPANNSMVGVRSIPIHLSEDEQLNLDIDPVTGKSINPIVLVNSLGIVIRGARTLDGNSMDYKYIPVMRTLIFIEQSCKLALNGFAFEHNDNNTWETIRSRISSFLASIWKQGGLQGTTEAEAFLVECGLGTTMTADDILNGFINLNIQLAIAHPAEYIVITLRQQQASS